MFSPGDTGIRSSEDRVPFPTTAFISSIEVPINTSNKMGTKTSRGTCHGRSRGFWTPCRSTVLTRRTKRVRCVSINTEHPCCFVECCRHVAACNCLVILNRIDLCGNTRPLPTCPFIIRPFDGHTQ